MKTKKEYMKEYKAKNPQILVCAIISIVFDVIGFLIISLKITAMTSKDYVASADTTSFIISMVITVIAFIAGGVLFSVSRKCEKKGLKEYEDYLKNNN